MKLNNPSQRKYQDNPNLIFSSSSSSSESTPITTPKGIHKKYKSNRNDVYQQLRDSLLSVNHLVEGKQTTLDESNIGMNGISIKYYKSHSNNSNNDISSCDRNTIISSSYYDSDDILSDEIENRKVCDNTSLSSSSLPLSLPLSTRRYYNSNVTSLRSSNILSRSSSSNSSNTSSSIEIFKSKSKFSRHEKTTDTDKDDSLRLDSITHKIYINDFKFLPEILTINQFDSITFINRGERINHIFTCVNQSYDYSGEFEFNVNNSSFQHMFEYDQEYIITSELFSFMKCIITVKKCCLLYDHPFYMQPVPSKTSIVPIEAKSEALEEPKLKWLDLLEDSMASSSDIEVIVNVKSELCDQTIEHKSNPSHSNPIQKKVSPLIGSFPVKAVTEVECQPKLKWLDLLEDSMASSSDIELIINVETVNQKILPLVGSFPMKAVNENTLQKAQFSSDEEMTEEIATSPFSDIIPSPCLTQSSVDCAMDSPTRSVPLLGSFPLTPVKDVVMSSDILVDCCVSVSDTDIALNRRQKRNRLRRQKKKLRRLAELTEVESDESSSDDEVSNEPIVCSSEAVVNEGESTAKRVSSLSTSGINEDKSKALFAFIKGRETIQTESIMQPISSDASNPVKSIIHYHEEFLLSRWNEIDRLLKNGGIDTTVTGKYKVSIVVLEDSVTAAVTQ